MENDAGLVAAGGDRVSMRTVLALVLLLFGSAGALCQPHPQMDYSGRTLESQHEQGPTTLDGVQSYKYNAMNRLTEVRNPIGQINYSLDALGNVFERSVSGAGTVKYEFDDAGRLLKVVAADGKQTRYAYDPAGRAIRIERDLNPRGGQAQALITHRRFDAVDRLASVAEIRRVGMGDTLVAGQKLTRIPGGAITRIDTYRAGTYDPSTGEFAGTPAVSRTFEHDGNARLTRETQMQGGAAVETRYDYTPAGNRARKTTTTGAGTEITTYSYDAADRLTQESTSLAAGGNRIVSYTYDGNGNLASRTEPARTTLYRFDPRSRLIDIRIGGTPAEAAAKTAAVRYAYDMQGNRVRKWTSRVRGYLIDINSPFPQVAAEVTGNEWIHYVRGLELIRQIRITESGTEDLFPLYGHLGTSLGAVTVNGDLAEEVDVDAFGNPVQSSDLKQSHLFAGEYWDQDSQLLYLRARWYDPKIGRFISADPLEGKQADPRSLNRYVYAQSDPLHRWDPSGKFSLGELGEGLKIVAINGALGAGASGGIEYMSSGDIQEAKKAALVGGVVGGFLGGGVVGLKLAQAYMRGAAQSITSSSVSSGASGVAAGAATSTGRGVFVNTAQLVDDGIINAGGRGEGLLKAMAELFGRSQPGSIGASVGLLGQAAERAGLDMIGNVASRTTEFWVIKQGNGWMTTVFKDGSTVVEAAGRIIFLFKP